MSRAVMQDPKHSIKTWIRNACQIRGVRSEIADIAAMVLIDKFTQSPNYPAFSQDLSLETGDLESNKKISKFYDGLYYSGIILKSPLDIKEYIHSKIGPNVNSVDGISIDDLVEEISMAPYSREVVQAIIDNFIIPKLEK